MKNDLILEITVSEVHRGLFSDQLYGFCDLKSTVDLLNVFSDAFINFRMLVEKLELLPWSGMQECYTNSKNIQCWRLHFCHHYLFFFRFKLLIIPVGWSSRKYNLNECRRTTRLRFRGCPFKNRNICRWCYYIFQYSSVTTLKRGELAAYSMSYVGLLHGAKDGWQHCFPLIVTGKLGMSQPSRDLEIHRLVLQVLSWEMFFEHECR